MQEIYEGYQVCTYWNMKGMGFDFHIYGKDGREAAHSKEPYFFEENALKAGKDAGRESGEAEPEHRGAETGEESAALPFLAGG